MGTPRSTVADEGELAYDMRVAPTVSAMEGDVVATVAVTTIEPGATLSWMSLGVTLSCVARVVVNASASNVEIVAAMLKVVLTAMRVT